MFGVLHLAVFIAIVYTVADSFVGALSSYASALHDVSVGSPYDVGVFYFKALLGFVYIVWRALLSYIR